jgi:hypothetical protein
MASLYSAMASLLFPWAPNIHPRSVGAGAELGSIRSASPDSATASGNFPSSRSTLASLTWPERDSGFPSSAFVFGFSRVFLARVHQHIAHGIMRVR